jgi:hypothetical protein
MPIIVTYVASRDNVPFMKTECQQLFNELVKSGALISKDNRFNHLAAPKGRGAPLAQFGAAAHLGLRQKT